MKQFLYCGIVLIALTASGWSYAASPLNIPELCGAEFVDSPENRVYRGKFKNYRGSLETALVITPNRNDEGKIVVFYLWGVQPKWDISEAGCVLAMATEEENTLTVPLRRGKVRVTYKFSGDKASVKYKWSGGGTTRTTKGKVTLSDS